MPTLEELRNKWFLKLTSNSSIFPPMSRHNGSQIHEYTDGNTVSPLIDGEKFMEKWYKLMQSATSNSEIYHAGWGLDDVITDLSVGPPSDALKALKSAHNNGVKIYVLQSFHMGNKSENALITLELGGIDTAFYDPRTPAVGSTHQKFTCFKSLGNSKVLLGSIDISKDRWDRQAHLINDPARPKGPTHDLGMMIEGPAVADLELTFRERWNDRKYLLWQSTRPDITTPLSSTPAIGTHSVQVLHTYGQINIPARYSWSSVGEFTVWAAYLNAIKNAMRYIYIEDQYFFPFDWPICADRKDQPKARDSDIIYQLGQALRRRVNVIVLVPAKSEDLSIGDRQNYQRDIGITYLLRIASTFNLSDNLAIASLQQKSNSGTVNIFVHAKLMICDDEFVLVGSSNFNQRSMTHDSELDIGIVDEANTFARELRKSLWAEHTQRSKESLDELNTAIENFKIDVNSGNGRLHKYMKNNQGDPIRHGFVLRHFIDPYGGPQRE